MQVGQHTYGQNNITKHFESDSGQLYIGKFCSIAEHIHIFLGGGHPTKWVSTFPFGIVSKDAFPVEPKEGVAPTNGNVVIGNDVWIANGVTIMSGVTIGDGAVIAANSHVVKDVGPYEMHGGNPAKLIRPRFDSKIIEALLDLKWWDYPEESIRKIIDLLSMEPTLDLIKEMKNKLNG